MNSTIPKRNAGTLRNRNVLFQSKNQNGDRNSIDSYGHDNFSENGVMGRLSMRAL